MSLRKKHGFHRDQKEVKESSWMLFRKTNGSDDPIDFFNDCLDELSSAELFDTERSLYQYLDSSAVLGMPYVLEVGKNKSELSGMIKAGKYDDIARIVNTMNGKSVEYDGQKFSYSKLDLGKANK